MTPKRALVPAIERGADRLRGLFGGIALNVSDATPPAVARVAQAALGAEVIVP